MPCLLVCPRGAQTLRFLGPSWFCTVQYNHHLSGFARLAGKWLQYGLVSFNTAQLLEAQELPVHAARPHHYCRPRQSKMRGRSSFSCLGQSELSKLEQYSALAFLGSSCCTLLNCAVL
ncbi:hypothetical protein BCV70DRAFT_84289 [Testicularia cyperi]|uniref:Uncharacterized protein n=1 Tax=Testicularia cyperi TaxID=1882483 RepID=A0A317XSL4_9BASI|nr:hypothetical protein BCV70DRAFT_84289 [Testicularia cyperi]